MAALLTIALILQSSFSAHEPVVDPEFFGVDTLLQEEYTIGLFRNATRLTLSPQGWIYIVDADEHAVLLFTSPQVKPRSVGGYGWATTSFDRPTGITTDGLSVYAADYNNHRIQRFDRNLNFLCSFSTRDTTEIAARFGFPTGVALSRLGDLFILDSENFRIEKFTAQLRHERSFGGIEAERGKLRQPLKILLSSDDHVYVLEPERLVEFDYFGNYLRSIGQGILQDAQGFDVGKEGIVVAMKDSLLWFSFQGQIQTILPVSTILASVSLSPLHDVLVSGDRLYLLTPRRLVVMKTVAPK